jgi:hypothetical protein
MGSGLPETERMLFYLPTLRALSDPVTVIISPQTPQPGACPHKNLRRMRNGGSGSKILAHASGDHRITHRRQTPTQQHNPKTFPHQHWKRLRDIEVAERYDTCAHPQISDSVGVDEGEVDSLAGSKGFGFRLCYGE